MIADNILKTEQTLVQRGIPADSYFEVEFFDGSVVCEKNVNWSAFSTPKIVTRLGQYQTVYISNYKIKKIRIFLSGLETNIENISEDLDVYQFIKSERLLARGIDKNTLQGRAIGIVKNGIVIEEKFINALETRIEGMKI